MPSKRDNVIDDNSVGLNEIDVLYSYAMVLSRNRTEAAGMVHETYLHAIKAKDSLRVGANIKSWLLAILRNIWINQFCDGRNPPDMTVVDQRIADVAVKRVRNYMGSVKPRKSEYSCEVRSNDCPYSSAKSLFCAIMEGYPTGKSPAF